MRTQIIVNGEWVDGAPAVNEWYRKEVIVGVWQEQRNVAAATPVPIVITGMSGALSHAPDFSRATMYEEATVTVTGTLLIPDRIFALPIRRNDGRLFVFAAEVVGGAFTVLINFPTCGSFLYSDDECNIDLPPGTFTVAPIRFDVLRVIPS